MARSREYHKQASTSNGDAINTSCQKMMDIVDDPTKVLNKSFMMKMFCKYVDTIPPFKKYWDHLFKKKLMVVVVSESGTKVLQFGYGVGYFGNRLS
jgi:hypothetical protein